MEGIRSIISRLPEHELQIRRRCAHDVQFRAICADFEDASKALRYWLEQAAGGGDAKDSRAAEYESFLAELEAEILALLSASAVRASG